MDGNGKSESFTVLVGDLLVAIEKNLFASIAVGLYAVDREAHVCALNPKGAALLGWTPEQNSGLFVQETLLLGWESSEMSPAVRVLQTGEPQECESDTFRRVDGSLLSVWWAATPIYKPGQPTIGPAPGVLVAFGPCLVAEADAEKAATSKFRVRSDLNAARQTISELAWAAEVTQALSSASTEVEALSRLAKMAVPRLCDVIMVHRVDDQGHCQEVAAAAAPGLDPRVVRAVEKPITHDGLKFGDRINGKIPNFLTVLESPDVAASTMVSHHARDLLGAIGAGAVMVVPMAARDHVVAVAEMINVAGGAASFGEADRSAVVDLAHRVGLAIDNLRLLQVERNAAIILQQALLPKLPEIPGLLLACRYLPARDIHRVGGDWYDAFLCPSDADTAMLVIGDVVGHDLKAATAMAAIRNLLRGIAVSARNDPDGLLSVVDRHLGDLGITSTATAIVASITRHAQAGDGSGMTMTWSSAGHLPPILIFPDGKVERLDSRPDLLLGSGIVNERSSHRQYLPPGSTLVFYTDGLVEKPGEDIDIGIEQLITAVRYSAVDCPDPETILNGILDRLTPSLDDDTAVLVVHLI